MVYIMDPLNKSMTQHALKNTLYLKSGKHKFQLHIQYEWLWRKNKNMFIKNANIAKILLNNTYAHLHSPNHRHPVSLSLALTWKNKAQQQQAVPSLCLPSQFPDFPLRAAAQSHRTQIPEGQGWHQPPMSPVNCDLWRSRREKKSQEQKERKKVKAVDVSSALWSKKSYTIS